MCPLFLGGKKTPKGDGAVQIIVGLGNPGREYQDTRHNAGFLALSLISRQTRIRLLGFRFHGRWGEGVFHGHSLGLLKPRTYMNLSGKSVAAALAHHRLGPEALIIIHDDMDLQVGTLRLRPGGGDGGHRGLRSIIDALGTTDFARVRIGIGQPEESGDPVEYVLSPFSEAEKVIISPALQAAAAAALAIITDGLPQAMNRFNRRPPKKTDSPPHSPLST